MRTFLQKLCSSRLSELKTPQNVLHLLAIVWTRDYDALREHLLDFAARQMRALMALPVWPEFERDNERIAFELFKWATLANNRSHQ